MKLKGNLDRLTQKMVGIFKAKFPLPSPQLPFLPFLSLSLTLHTHSSLPQGSVSKLLLLNPWVCVCIYVSNITSLPFYLCCYFLSIFCSLAYGCPLILENRSVLLVGTVHKFGLSLKRLTPPQRKKQSTLPKENRPSQHTRQEEMGVPSTWRTPSKGGQYSLKLL